MQTRKTIRASRLLSVTLFHLLMIPISVVMVVPFLWMISSSLKEVYEVFKVPVVWIPIPPKLENYVEIFRQQPMLQFILNSIKITLCVIVGQVFLCSLAAYSFARIPFRAKQKIFFAYISTLMIPAQVIILPMYLLLVRIGWADTHMALIVPGLFSAYGVFLMRQFFLGIPKELEEAAEIDGCSIPRTFWRIMLPQVKPALATLTVFCFMGVWNDFLGPLIYLTTPEKFTLTLGLAFFQGTYTTQWNYVMAGSVISVTPIFIAYVFAQRYFVEGISMSGIKG